MMTEVAVSEENKEDGSDWVDVTQLLDECASKLELGEMLQGPLFSLHRAMSAVEIGDHVLDCTMPSKLVYLDSLLQDKDKSGLLFDAMLQNDKLVSIFDSIFCLMWSYLCGNSDRGSLFICLYFHDSVRDHKKFVENNEKNPWLSLYCDAILLCCAISRDIVYKAQLHDDDDWHPRHAYNLYEKVRFGKNVHEVITEIARQRELIGKDLEKDDKNELLKAIDTRFQCIHVLLSTLSEMRHVICDFYKNKEEEKEQEMKEKENENENEKANETGKEKEKGKGKEKEKEKETKKGKENETRKSKQEEDNKSHSQSNTKEDNKSQKSPGKGKGKHNKNKHKNKGKGKHNKNQNKQNKNSSNNNNNNNNNSKESAKKTGDDFMQDVISSQKEEMMSKLYVLGICENLQCDKKIVNEKDNECMKQSICKLAYFASILIRLCHTLEETIKIGIENPPGFEEKALNEYQFGHSQRRHNILPKETVFFQFGLFVKTLKFLTSNLTKVNNFDSFMSFLDSFAFKRDRYLFDDFDLSKLDENKKITNESPNIVLRGFLFVTIDEWYKNHNFFWLELPLVHFIQKSFLSFNQWCRIPIEFKLDSCFTQLADVHTFFERVAMGTSDIIRSYLTHVCQMSGWHTRVFRNCSILENDATRIDKTVSEEYRNRYFDFSEEVLMDCKKYNPNPSGFKSWIVKYTITSLMNDIYLRLGILNLFASYEYCYVYWYLHYLIRSQCTIVKNSFNKTYYEPSLKELKKLEKETKSSNMAYANSANANVKRRLKMQKQKREKEISQWFEDSKDKIELRDKIQSERKESDFVERDAEKDSLLFCEVNAYRYAIYGIFLFLEGLRWMSTEYANLLKFDGLLECNHGSNQLRFEHRFHEFGNVMEPMPLHYLQYEGFITNFRKNECNGKLMKMFQHANESFKMCISQLNRLKDPMQYFRSENQFELVSTYETDYWDSVLNVVTTNKGICRQVMEKFMKFKVDYVSEKKLQNIKLSDDQMIHLKCDFNDNLHFLSFRFQ